MNLTYALLNTIIKYPVASTQIDPKSGNIKDKKIGYYYADREIFRESQEEKMCIRDRWEPYVERLKWLRGELEKLKALELIRLPGQEPSKLVISTRKTSMTGRQLQELLLELSLIHIWPTRRPTRTSTPSLAGW